MLCAATGRSLLAGMTLTAVQAAIVVRCRFFSSRWRGGRRPEIKGVDVVLPGNANQCEEGITPGIGERCSHPVRRRGFTDGADWPVRCNPFSRGMRQHGCEIDDAS